MLPKRGLVLGGSSSRDKLSKNRERYINMCDQNREELLQWNRDYKRILIRSNKLYPISLSLKKLKDILDVNKPMDPDCFNMAVRMLACNEALLWCEDKYHYMDLQFCVS